MNNELYAALFEEDDDLRFYRKLDFKDEKQRKELEDSLAKYQCFLTTIEVMQDGDEVEDESTMVELFEAIELSKLNVEARTMYIRMLNQPSYLKEREFKELCQEMKGYTEINYKIKNGELNYLYLRACEYLAEFYLQNGLYYKILDLYKDIDYRLISFDDEVFEFMLFQKLIASIYTSNESEYRSIYQLALAADIHQEEMFSFSEFLYRIIIGDEEQAKHQLKKLILKNKFTMYCLDELVGETSAIYISMCSFYEESKYNCIKNIFSYYSSFINSPYYRERITDLYLSLKKINTSDIVCDGEKVIDWVELMRSAPYYEGVSTEDLQRLAAAGYKDADDFLGITMWIVSEETGVEMSVLKKIEENGVEFDEEDYDDSYLI